MRPDQRCILGLCLIVLGNIGAVGARELFMAPPITGSLKIAAAAAGSRTNPLCSFDRIQQMVEPGDVVWLYDGDYEIDGPINFHKSGMAGKPITYRGLGKNARIRAKEVSVNGSHIVYRDMTVSNEGFGFSLNWTPVSHVTIKNCTMFGNSRAGVYIGRRPGGNPDDFKYIIVEDCTIRDNSLDNKVSDGQGGKLGNEGWAGALQIDGASYVILRNNAIYRNYGEGITLTNARNCKAYGNTIHDNFSVNLYFDMAENCDAYDNVIYNENGIFRSAINAFARGIQCSNEEPWAIQNRNCRIYNNIVINTSRNFDASWTRTGNQCIDGFVIVNNSFYGATENNINITSAQGTNTFANNIIAGKGSMGVVSSGAVTLRNNCWSAQSPRSGQNEIVNTDPLFVSAGVNRFVAEGYRLQANSPCVDKGAVMTVGVLDFAGNQRPAGPAWDIGVFETGAQKPAVAPLTKSISVSKPQFTITAQLNANPPTQSFEVWNGSSWESFPVTITADQRWVAGAGGGRDFPTQNISDAKTRIDFVIYSAAYLTAGEHTATITIASEGIDSLRIPVKVAIAGNRSLAYNPMERLGGSGIVLDGMGRLTAAATAGSSYDLKIYTPDGRLAGRGMFPGTDSDDCGRRAGFDTYRIPVGTHLVKFGSDSGVLIRKLVLLGR